MFGQVTIVSGKVTESTTGSPIPFANVIFTGTSEGAITDFDGNFSVTTRQPVDSLEVRYIGYIKRVKPLVAGEEQVINFQLDEDLITLGEVVVYSGENPAFAILRKVIRNKGKNDQRALSAYEYESYTKIEFDVDNISERLKKRKIMQRITAVMDSIEHIAGDDGQPVLPLFLSETISKFYYKKDPTFRHENIIKTNVHGIGITDGTLTAQVIGSSFQQYNFYRNWMNIVSKEFVSPIAEGGRIYYEYDLIDSLYLGDDFCYRIDFIPKREQDLAFIGTMWINKDDYALKRIDATVPKSANLNFVEKLKIQEDLIKTEAGPWLPHKTRVVVDVIDLTKKTPSMIAKFYISTSDHKVNQPHPNKFYLNPVSMEETITEFDDSYWANHRHDSLTSTEENVFKMIDSLKEVPIVKASMDLSKFAFNGYHKIGMIEIGPYTTFVGNNDIEGWRAGFGARTSIDFSKHWLIGGHVGYGFLDERWKYRVYVENILDRKRWTTLRLEHQREVEQVWVLNEDFEPFSFLYGLSRFGTLNEPFLTEKYQVKFFRQHATGFSQDIRFTHESYDPQFNFNYLGDPSDPGGNPAQNFSISEVSVDTRYAKDEMFVINDNTRLSLGTTWWPAFNFKYSYGMKDVLGSAFEYHKFKFSIEKRQKMGLLGIGMIKGSAGYISGGLPYPLLYNPIGNESLVYVDFAYNLMNYFEFSTDKYAELRYRHSFEGIILNTIPLIKKLKLRVIADINILYGDMSEDSFSRVIYPLNDLDQPIIPFRSFDSRPYIEVGYGVENILRVLSIQAFHRLTYLDQSNINKFGLKFNLEFNL